MKQRLDAYPDFLAPLKEAASRYLEYTSAIANDGVNGGIAGVRSS